MTDEERELIELEQEAELDPENIEFLRKQLGEKAGDNLVKFINASIMSFDPSYKGERISPEDVKRNVHGLKSSLLELRKNLAEADKRLFAGTTKTEEMVSKIAYPLPSLLGVKERYGDVERERSPEKLAEIDKRMLQEWEGLQKSKGEELEAEKVKQDTDKFIHSLGGSSERFRTRMIDPVTGETTYTGVPHVVLPFNQVTKANLDMLGEISGHTIDLIKTAEVSYAQALRSVDPELARKYDIPANKFKLQTEMSFNFDTLQPEELLLPGFETLKMDISGMANVDWMTSQKFIKGLPEPYQRALIPITLGMTGVMAGKLEGEGLARYYEIAGKYLGIKEDRLADRRRELMAMETIQRGGREPLPGEAWSLLEGEEQENLDLTTLFMRKALTEFAYGTSEEGTIAKVPIEKRAKLWEDYYGAGRSPEGFSIPSYLTDIRDDFPLAEQKKKEPEPTSWSSLVGKSRRRVKI